ncbi:hypothetical protein I5Q34_15115 [Streptomyces sp. AV19]|uniref:DUF6255 family natural product biosynthesis protein n=1 Tax=Streptomyces sp. AV19 TaxID=2793068 RepID=UPI0018FE67DC|nr:DUF6255 family natural product biosynthesis protein [Streptomyces sp. AV19]MBH1935585.1 hypothetical protein [Streptomyces sp. AV19]MDG4534472.1 DUF6255 family natural product biosynthesis protein [Streptomyces sp. AV19]
MYTTGHLVHHCRHHSGWEQGNGEAHCRDCGTRRFTDYGALRPPEHPATGPSPQPTRDRTQADRSAAALIARGLHNLSRWGTGNRMWHLAV